MFPFYKKENSTGKKKSRGRAYSILVHSSMRIGEGFSFKESFGRFNYNVATIHQNTLGSQVLNV